LRHLFFALVILIGMGAFANYAEAQNYPWCAIYGDSSGGSNCGFSTFQQCMADVRSSAAGIKT